MAKFNASEFNRKLREAQRRTEQEVRREIERVNRANTKAIDDYNRRAEAHNRRAIAEHNREVDRYNRRAEAHNERVIGELNKKLRSAHGEVRYTPSEQVLADRVSSALVNVEGQEYDTFLSYARIDGADVANALRSSLEALGVRVWFDEVAIRPGLSQSRQMDVGLRKARSGIALLTPAYLAGRFWTERELGPLLGKDTLIPVLHRVTFADVEQYSGILPDLAGFTTARDEVATIAEKIAAAILLPVDRAQTGPSRTTTTS